MENIHPNERGAETTCAYCEEEVYHPIFECGNCKATCYCNEECQKAHWKLHKHRCDKIKEARESAEQSNKKRLYRLFQEWKEESRQIRSEMVYGMFGFDLLSKMEQLRLVVYIKVEFDYNSFTFVPTESPRIVPVSKVYGPTAEQIHSLYDEVKNMPHRPSHVPSDIDLAYVISYIEYDNGSRAMIQHDAIEYECRSHMLPPVTMETLALNLKREVTLTSKKQKKWIPLLQKNLKKQIKFLQKHKCFKDLVAHALWMQTLESSRIASHTVVIHVKEGFNLGEIKSLSRYEVVPTSQAWEKYRNIVGAKTTTTTTTGTSNNGNSSREDIVMKEKIMGDQHSSGGGSGSGNVSVLFLGSSKVMCRVVSLDSTKLLLEGGRQGGRDDDENHPKLTTNASNRKALEEFISLTRVILPHVESPELN